MTTWTRIPMARGIAALALGVALTIGVGCENRTAENATADTQDAQAALPEIVQKAVAVAKDLKAEPDDVEAVLERHGLDLEKLEDMMYEISSNSSLAKAYDSAIE